MTNLGFDFYDYMLLIIDDDQNNLRVIVGFLETIGCQVVVARDGESGVKRAKFVNPDLILLDVMMPGIDGFETCRRLKADDTTRDIPVIFMTALDNVEDKVAGFEAGGVDYITKPIQTEEVLYRVQTHLQLKMLSSQLKVANEILSERVEERTEALIQSNRELQAEIIERQEVEASLRASEARFRALYRDNPSMFFTINAEGIITSVNPFGASQLGYTVDQLEGQPMADLFYEDDKPAVIEMMETCLQHTGQMYTWQYRKLRQDEQLMWVEEFARAIDTSDGALQVYIVSHDITERKQAEDEINQRNRELTLLNRVIAVSGKKNDINTVLETTCRELTLAFECTYAAAALLNDAKTEATVVAENSQQPRIAALGQVIPIADFPIAQDLFANKRPLIIDHMKDDLGSSTAQDFLKQNGVGSVLVVPIISDEDVIGCFGFDTSKPGQFSNEEVALAQSVANQIAGVLTRIRIDQERQELQTQYFQSQKMEAIGQLAGGIVHDLNNFLVPVIGYVELGLMSLSPGTQLYEQMQEVRGAADRAANLTRQILAFSRKQVLEMKIVDLNEIVSGFETMLQRLIEEDIEFRTVLRPGIHLINADRSQIEQVLLNLVVNARDAMTKGGKLTIETSNVYLDDANTPKYRFDQPPGHYAMLAVSDTGHGMDENTTQQIFEPFFTTKEVGKGTGLGLATVFGIIKQHNGNIWVYSEVDQGTTFKIYLPQANEDESIPDSSNIDLDSTNGMETVLVAEDDQTVRRFVCETLMAYGYNVLEAASPTACIQLASDYKETINLILTDVIMPEMNGQELYQAISLLHPNIRVVYMSGYTDDVILHRSYLNEGFDFLQKPFSIRDLLFKVRKTLDLPLVQ